MARIRSYKPEFYRSESLGSVSLAAERTFGGLITEADDRGRVRDQPAVLNGALWPLRPEHTAVDMETDLAELVREGLICRYTGCDGKQWLHLITWDSHQRVEKPSRSRAPVCPRHRADDYCGRHDLDDCPPITLTSIMTPPKYAEQSEPDTDSALFPGPSPTTPGALPEPSRSPHPQDLGPRNLDLGTRTLDPQPPPAANTSRQPPISEAKFAEFWDTYPRKVAKADARKAWIKAVKAGVDPDEITTGARRYRDDPTRQRSEPKYTKHPAAWLNGERWTDQPAAPTRASPGTGHVPYRDPDDASAYQGAL
jgi:hypothetical protein